MERPQPALKRSFLLTLIAGDVVITGNFPGT